MTSCTRITSLLHSTTLPPPFIPTFLSRNTCITFADISYTSLLIEDLSQTTSPVEIDEIIESLARHLVCKVHGDARAEAYHVLGVWMEERSDCDEGTRRWKVKGKVKDEVAGQVDVLQGSHPRPLGAEIINLDEEQDEDEDISPLTTPTSKIKPPGEASFHTPTPIPTQDPAIEAKLRILRRLVCELPLEISYTDPPFHDMNIFWLFILDQNSYMHKLLYDMQKAKHDVRILEKENCDLDKENRELRKLEMENEDLESEIDALRAVTDEEKWEMEGEILRLMHESRRCYAVVGELEEKIRRMERERKQVEEPGSTDVSRAQRDVKGCLQVFLEGLRKRVGIR